QVLVTGRLQSRNWETEDGQKRSAVEIEAEEVAASLVAEGAGQTYTRPGVTRKAS
ncbi:MAG: Single-strand binding protein family, partial [Actinomycetota bacterium]|nr:Single-strand binding protein family [Actinomycetota bacterium]